MFRVFICSMMGSGAASKGNDNLNELVRGF